MGRLVMSEWIDSSLGELCDQRKGITYKSKDYCEEGTGFPFLTIKTFEKGGGFDPSGLKYYNGPFLPQDILKQDDVLIAVTDLTRAGDIVGSPLLVPNFGTADFALASMDCMKLTPIAQKCDKKFLYYSLMHSDIRRQMVASSRGSTVLHLDTKRIPDMKIKVPARKKVQNKIAEILSTIDSQIEQTEALIAKQENIRQGLMQDLFTRGVDETGQLRPAYEDAPHLYHETELGWLPLEWEVTSLQKLTSKVTSGSRDWAKYYSIQGAVFVRIGNMTRKNIHLSLEEKKHVAPPQSSEGLRTSLQPADLLISITADLGIIGLIPDDLGEAYINQHIALVRLEDLDLSEFIGNFLTTAAGQRQFQRYNDAGAKSGMNLPTVMSLKVPSLNTKKESDKITKMINVMDTGIKNLKIESAKLQKQKAGLMRDLLSGEVSVAPLMQETSA